MEKINKATKIKEIIDSTGFSPIQTEELTNKIIQELQAKKEAIVRERFAEKGFAHLLADVEKRRFKKILIERLDNCEKWYADDGSVDGVLIITFKNTEPTLPVYFNESITIKAEIQYY